MLRPLTDADSAASQRLGFEAFGFPDAPAPWRRLPGATTFGAFESDTLIGKTTDRAYESYWHGQRLPTSGIAGVVVRPEQRGTGLLRDLFATTLDHAADRGAAVSTLFPTAPGIYRGLSYEIVGSYDTVSVSLASLATLPVPTGVTVRRAEAGDVPAIRSLYDEWAAAHNGPLSRRGVSFVATDQEFLEGFSGVTVATSADGTIGGYACWDRGGRGYGPERHIDVGDLITVTASARTALLSFLGGFSSIAGSAHIDTSGDDVVLGLRDGSWRLVEPRWYMLRLLDVTRACTGQAVEELAAAFDDGLGFSVEGDRLERLDGGYVVTVADGHTHCERVTDVASTGPVFSSRGLARAYAGAESMASLRMTGLVRGDASRDRVFDLWWGGRQRHIRNYF